MSMETSGNPSLGSTTADVEALVAKLQSLAENLTNGEALAVLAQAKEKMSVLINGLQQALKLMPEESVDLAKIFGLLATVMVEAGQYQLEAYNKDETDEEKQTYRDIHEVILPTMVELRALATETFKIFFQRDEFADIRHDLVREIIPLIKACNARDRFMPFRVLLVGRLADRLFLLSDRTTSPRLKDLLSRLFDTKYPRFGTSGLRGLWDKDFTELKAKRVTQAVCDFVKTRGLADKPVVIGYDSRKYALLVAKWVAEVCLENGFRVYFAARDTPTPALIYWGTENLGSENIAAFLNCTASHNPIEWHGIKYSQPNGCPAPTWLTDWIGSRANRLQLEGRKFRLHEDLDKKWVEWRAGGRVIDFDPIVHFCEWLLGKAIDAEAIRSYFHGKNIVIDEMYGAGRGYLREIFDRIGVRYEVLHEKDELFGNLKYANPEPPFLEDCIRKVVDGGASLGLAMDADADRYGVVDGGGIYFRPNQILPLLIDYLVGYKKWRGKIVRTQTTSRAVDAVTRRLLENSEYNRNIVTPHPDEVPSYINHPFYRIKIGQREDMRGLPVYAVFVGIKYIVELMERDPLFRDAIIVGGEESSGLTTKGHLPDKDGPWACLLISEMIAVRQKSLTALWGEFTEKYGRFCSSRVDVSATDEVKERLLDYYLDLQEVEGGSIIAGLKITYLGGVRYDNVEVILVDQETGEPSYLIVRASGTEPLVRIYTESASEEKRREIEREVLGKLEMLCAVAVNECSSYYQLADTLIVTEPWESVVQAVCNTVGRLAEGHGGAGTRKLIERLQLMMDREDRLKIEWRNKEIVGQWLKIFRRLFKNGSRESGS